MDPVDTDQDFENIFIVFLIFSHIHELIQSWKSLIDSEFLERRMVGSILELYWVGLEMCLDQL